MSKIDLTGMVFGRWTVLSLAESKGRKSTGIVVASVEWRKQCMPTLYEKSLQLTQQRYLAQ